MELENKDLKCDKCVYETLLSGVSFLVCACEEHNKLFLKEISNAMSVQQDLIVRSHLKKNKT